MLFLAVPALLQADPRYTWVGPAAGGNWDVAANWEVSGEPESDYTPVAGGPGGAYLPSTGVDRNIVYSGFKTTGADGRVWTNWLRDITIAQEAPALNALSVEQNLRLGNAMVLGAEGGGTAVLRLDNSQMNAQTIAGNRKRTPRLILEMGYRDQTPRVLTVGKGGLLDFAGSVYDDGNSAIMVGRGCLLLDGGAIHLRQGERKGSNRSILYAVNDDVVIRSGQIVFGAPAGGVAEGVSDVRFFAGNRFTVYEGHFVNQGGGAKQFWFSGASVVFFGSTVIDPGIAITLGGGRNQMLLSSVALNDVIVRPDGQAVKTVAVYAEGGNIGRIGFAQNRADTPAVLRLGSGLRVREGAQLPGADNVAPAEQGATVIYEIDTAGYTLDLRANPEAWKPDRPNRNVRAVPMVI